MNTFYNLGLLFGLQNLSDKLISLNIAEVVVKDIVNDLYNSSPLQMFLVQLVF